MKKMPQRSNSQFFKISKGSRLRYHKDYSRLQKIERILEITKVYMILMLLKLDFKLYGLNLNLYRKCVRA